MEKVEKPKHAFGIKGKQRDAMGQVMRDASGQPIIFKGHESELIGEQGDLVEYERFIVTLTMGQRASTRPNKRDGDEGYCAAATVKAKFGGNTKILPIQAEQLNDQIDWTFPTLPHEFIWYFKKDEVKPGMQLNPVCEWVKPNAAASNYVYRLRLNKP